jgi:LPXTG-motif cell wall-anchored protein
MFKKIKKFFKGLIASTLSATTAVSGIAAIASVPVSAANEWKLETETGSGVNFRLYDSTRTSDNAFGHPNYHINFEEWFTLVNQSTGERIVAFCMEPGHNTTAGNSYGTGEDVSVAWSKIGTDGKRRINIAGLWYEWYHSGKHGSTYSSLARSAVQWYIWKVASEYGSTGNGDSYDTIDWNYINSSPDQERAAYITDFYHQIETYVNNFSKKPDMRPDAATAAKCSETSNGQCTKYNINPGDTLTWYDYNAVLSDSKYYVEPSTISGITVTKNGNSIVMNISSTYRNINKVTLPTYKEFKDSTGDNGKFTIFTGGDIQELVSPMSPRFIDPSEGEVSVQLNMGKITVEKTDSIYGDVLNRTTFEVYNSSNEKVATLTTGNDGKATTDWLLYDTYTVKETVPKTGYNNDNAAGKTVTVNGESASVEFTDKIIQGWVELNKSDADTSQKLEGAVFEIHRLSGPDGELTQAEQNHVVGTITTDSNGYAKSGLLDYGNYYLIEKTAAYGYYNPKTKYNFSITNEGATVTVNATNVRQTLEINVTKLDDNSDGFGTDTAGNKYKLEGAEFQLYQHVILRDSVTNVKYYEDDILIDTATSDENGLAKFELQTAYTSTLQFDSYYFIKESKAPIGYKLNDTKTEVVYEYGDQYQPAVVINMTYENEIKKAPISVYKQDLETGEYLAGAVFEIKNDRNVVVDTITTTDEGKAVSKDLRPGTYKVTEITAPEHYQLSNIKDWGSNTEGTNTKEVEITIEQDAEGVYNAVGVETQFKNLHDKGKIKLTKVDGLTVDYNTVCDDAGENCVSDPVLKDDSVLLPGVSFAIYAKDDLSTPVFTGTTDENGELETILNTGEYYIQEIAAPAGYNVNPALMAFTLTTHGETVEKIITNMTVYGNISIYKIGEVLSDVKVDEESGLTELIYKNAYMGGVEFEVYANEDIYHPLTGKLLYKKDALVRKVTTGTDGKVIITDMPLGTYYVKEINAPEEHSIYDVTSDIKYITLTEEDANFEGVIENEARFMNERLTIDPQLYKVGAKLSKDTNSETEYEYVALPGAIFGVYNDEEITYIDEEGNEQVIKTDTLLGIMETNEEGFADVEVKIPFGKYYVKEIQAPEGYYLNEDKYPFELVWKQELQENNTLTVSISDPENPIVNYEIIIPQTGVNSTTLYTVTGVIIIAIAGAAMVINKKRNIEE